MYVLKTGVRYSVTICAKISPQTTLVPVAGANLLNWGLYNP